MANIHDNDILITKTNDNVFIDLDCSFGQPSVSTIYFHKNDGSSKELKSFDNNVHKLKIDNVENLKFNSIEIHTTIDDVKDNEQESQDIGLAIKVYDTESNFVDSSFTKKTTRKGTRFHSFYTVTII